MTWNRYGGFRSGTGTATKCSNCGHKRPLCGKCKTCGQCCACVDKGAVRRRSDRLRARKARRAQQHQRNAPAGAE